MLVLQPDVIPGTMILEEPNHAILAAQSGFSFISGEKRLPPTLIVWLF